MSKVTYQVASSDRYESYDYHASQVVHATDTVIGGNSAEISTIGYSTLVLWINYVKGDETSVTLTIKALRESGGEEYPLASLTSGSPRSIQDESQITMSSSVKASIQINVSGINIIKIYESATGGTPTGTLSVEYSLSNEG